MPALHSKTMKTRKITFGLILILIFCVGICRGEFRVLFTSNHQTNNYEIYTMATNGSDITRITTTAINEWAPAVSPNGIDIAFVSLSGATSSIYMTSVFGSLPVKLNNTNDALCVQFATTNTIYFLTGRRGWGLTDNIQLWKINTDGSGEELVYTNNLTCWPMGPQDFSINQENQNVYLSAFTNSFWPSVIQYGGVADTEIQGVLIYTNIVDRYAPELSPNTTKITFCADTVGGDHRLWADDAVPGGSPANQICDTYCGNPSWIDNNSIVFTRATNSTYGMSTYIGDIWRVNFDGSELTKLTSLGSCAYPSAFYLIPEPVSIYYFSFIIYYLLTGNFFLKNEFFKNKFRTGR